MCLRCVSANIEIAMSIISTQRNAETCYVHDWNQEQNAMACGVSRPTIFQRGRAKVQKRKNANNNQTPPSLYITATQPQSHAHLRAA